MRETKTRPFVIRLFSRLAPLVVVLVLWESAGDSNSRISFFFSTPTAIFMSLGTNLMNGRLIVDFFYTLGPTLTGLALGVTFGSACGFALLYRPALASFTGPYVVVLGSVPIFAVAPMMIVWFGIGLQMKVAMATLATFFVALTQAYNGGRAVPELMLRHFRLLGASNRDVFRKLTIPYSMDWVISSLKLNANLALLGTFIGEFMASERGLAHTMLRAGSLYDVPLVLASALCMMVIVVGLTCLIGAIDRNRSAILQLIAVDPTTRHSTTSTIGES